MPSDFPIPAPAPLAVDTVQAARLLSVAPRTLQALALRGEVPSFHVGRRRLFAVEALRAWTARQTDEARP